MKIKTNLGFTLLEAMVTVAILAIIVGIGIPSYQRFIQNSRLDNAARNIYSVFNSARQEAIASGQKGFVCRSLDNPVNSNNPRCRNVSDINWDFGLLAYKTAPDMVIVAPDGTFDNQRINSGNFNTANAASGAGIGNQERRRQLVIRSSDFPDNGVQYRSNSNDRVVVFNSDGSLQNDAPIRVAICDLRDEEQGRFIEINAVGKVSLRNIEGTTVDCDNP